MLVEGIWPGPCWPCPRPGGGDCCTCHPLSGMEPEGRMSEHVVGSSGRPGQTNWHRTVDSLEALQWTSRVLHAKEIELSGLKSVYSLGFDFTRNLPHNGHINCPHIRPSNYHGTLVYFKLIYTYM